ncbi:Alpha N-terminal protein methyltransferase 1 [Paramyrothecium foliicola]|nr:Alpha N-terminal protein methyltransferase 1 [Paramyrothecium foliicola]
MSETTTPPPPPDSLINQRNARQYWQSTQADLGGMLGGVNGYPALSKVDLQGSRTFLARLGIGRKSGLRRVSRAVDCGAGVDVVEPIAKFTKGLEGEQGIGRIFNTGLEDWDGGGGGDDDEGGEKYDLVWIQWCAGQLNDAQLVEFLQRCKGWLREDGVIVVKENNTRSGLDIFDELDSSVTRQDESFRSLFKASGLKLVRTELQRPFPKELFPVRMYALRPEQICDAGGKDTEKKQI